MNKKTMNSKKEQEGTKSRKRRKRVSEKDRLYEMMENAKVEEQSNGQG